MYFFIVLFQFLVFVVFSTNHINAFIQTISKQYIILKNKSYCLLHAKVPENPKELESNKWKTGDIFTKQTNKSKNKSIWWMRDDEESNPRMLPKYHKWWVDKNSLVNDTWDIKDLMKEANRRNISYDKKTISKNELIDSINKTTRLYDLSNDNFTGPIYIPKDMNKLPSCYPEVYDRSTEARE